MLYREIIAVCSEIHTKHIKTLCQQTVELFNVKLAVQIVTTVRYIYLLTYLLTYLLAYLLTYLLTPWSRVLLEKLTSKLCR